MIYTVNELLSQKTKQELEKHILLNGGEVKDNEFKELENYLKRNPKEEVIKYLDN